MTPWGSCLAAALSRRGWSVRHFAQQVGADASFISKAMRGALHGRSRRPALPPLNQVADWAQILQLTPDERDEFLDLAHLAHAPARVVERVRQTHVAYQALQEEHEQLRRELERLRGQQMPGGEGPENEPRL